MTEFQQQEEKPSMMLKVKRFGRECLRVLKVTKKPDRYEVIGSLTAILGAIIIFYAPR